MNVIQPTTIDPKLAMILGTSRLGRALTDEEKKYFEEQLRAHDFAGANSIALRFALKLRGGKYGASELASRARLQLVVLGWNPDEVTLAKRMCRLVWCEHHRVTREEKAMRRAEEAYLRELAVTDGIHLPQSGDRNRLPELARGSVEDYATRLEEEEQLEARAKAKLDELQAAFEAKKDEVNLIWLRHARKGETDLQKIAAACGRPVRDFYLAAERRKTIVKNMAAPEGGKKT